MPVNKKAAPKKQIGYFHFSGYRPGVCISALAYDIPTEEMKRIAVGVAIGFGHHATVETDGGGRNARVLCTNPHKGCGGACLRGLQEDDARDLRGIAKEAIRLAGFKPVRL